MKADWRDRLDAELEAAQGYQPNKADWLDGRWAGFKAAGGAEDRAAATPASIVDQLKRIGRRSRGAAGLPPAPTIDRLLENRRKAIENGDGIDWATAEALAFGTLLEEGYPSGCPARTVERGTFSQRHSVLIDQENEKRYIAAEPHLAPGRRASRSSIRCSPRRPCSGSNMAIRWPTRTR